MGIFSGLFKKDSSHVLVVNIGSAFVHFAMVSFSKGSAHMLHTVQKEIAVLTDMDFEAFTRAMEKALRAGLHEMHAREHQRPHRVAVYLASPWYASQVRVAKMARPTSFVISKSVLDDMISRELKAFEEEEIKGRRASDEQLTAIESKTIQVKLNGYAEPDPVGLSARELELSLFLSVAPSRTLSRITEIVSREYSSIRVSFFSFLAASFLVAQEFFPAEQDYLLVDVGGEVTDVSLVSGGALAQSASFPHGRNFILRGLSRGLKRSMEESVAICKLYAEDKVEEGVRDACTRILSSAKHEWLSSFQKALSALSGEHSIPGMILLTCEADVAPWFVQTIGREEFHQYGLTEKEFKVIVLSAGVFHTKLSFNPGVRRDPLTMIGTLASLTMNKRSFAKKSARSQRS